MKLLSIKPAIFRYETAQEFATDYNIGKNDIVLTNQYIYEPYFGNLNLECNVIYQEKYGSGEPTDAMAEAIARDILGKPERIIAIGGGTVLDLAKLYALQEFLPINDLYDGKISIKKDKELILVPTTCGTGSEMTNISILALLSRNTKKGLADDALYADAAVLVPELLQSLPFGVFATSSIDALVHAVESSLSPKGNDYTRMYGYKAIEIIINGYKKIQRDGKDARIPLLGDFLLASNYAGIAFGNAGCAAVHALSYPLGAMCHVAHGESNYAMFTGVMKNYLEIKQDGEISRLNTFLTGLLQCDIKNVYDALDELLSVLINKKPLHEYGLKEVDLENFTDSVLENQGRLLANNFVPLDRERILKIYRELY